MNLGNQFVKKWKKAIFGTVIGMIISAAFAIPIFLLSGQGLYLASIGLGMGIGFSIGSGMADHQLL